MIRRTLLFLAFALVLFVPSAFAQDGDAPTTPIDADAPLMLWSLADEDNTVYLLGSIHLTRPDFFPMVAPIEAAYASAEIVVFEVDLAEMQAEAVTIAQRGMFADSTRLSDVVSDSLYARTLDVTQTLGLPEMAVAQMEPWMLSLTLTSMELMTNGYMGGIDQHLYQRAAADSKSIQALETVEFQLSLFDTMPMDTQVNFLRYTLDEAGGMSAMLDGLVAAWTAGDAEALDAFMNEGMAAFPELETRLLDDRNAAWVPQIEALLEGTDDAFVVVGAGHLVGDESVVAMLEAKGHSVTRL